MANITGRVAKRIAPLLEPGEAVAAALLVEPKSTYGIASIAIAALPRSAVRQLERSAHSTHDAAGGLAASMPSGSCVLAVTDRRVVAIPSNGVSMKEIAAAFDRTDLAIGEVSSKGLGKRLRIDFVDGTQVVVDAQRGQPFDEFARHLLAERAP